MKHVQRRTFMIQVAAAGSVLAASRAVVAQATALAETDSQAVALAYKADGSKTDTKKFPNYEASQTCASCQLFQGKAGDAAGGCTLFPGKQVAAKGWCSAWVKKAA